MMRRGIAAAVVVSLVGCGNLFSRNVVARAGDDVLTVERLAQALVQSESAPQPAIVERLTWLRRFTD
jgi:hypothetical protein